VGGKRDFSESHLEKALASDGTMERVRWVNGGFTLNSSVRALMPFVHPGHRAYGTSVGPVE